jgi:hypothetical protein
MKGLRPERRCAYCGSDDAPTVDHVVSRALYPPSKATSRFARITVPACVPCNAGWTNDEPHFRNVLLLSGEPTPAVRELWEGKTRRSFTYSDGRKRALDLAVQMIPVNTPDGERHLIYPAKDKRVLRVVRKIVRGLCHHHGLLSPVHDGQVLADVQRFEVAPEFVAEMTSGHAEEEVLQYRFGVVDDRDIHSGWLLNFFCRTPFFCIVFHSVEALERLEVISRDIAKSETAV